MGELGVYSLHIMNGSKVFKELHAAFKMLRITSKSSRPSGVDFVMTGDFSSFLTLSIETEIDDKMVELISYNIELDGDTLKIKLDTIELHDPDCLIDLTYAVQMAELAHNHVNTNYDWTTA